MRGSRRGIVAYDVVVEHAADGVALLLGPFEQTIAAEETLFFAGNGGEEKRGSVRAFAAGGGFAEEAGGLHTDGNAGGIIVGTGSVCLGVHYIRRARIVMAGDDEERFGEFRVGARENGVDAFQRERLAGRALTGGIEFVDDDLELAAGGFGDFVEAGDDVIAAAADAALGVSPGGEGEAGAAGDELIDEGAHGFFVDAFAGYGTCGTRREFRMRAPLLGLRWIGWGGLLSERRGKNDAEANTCDENAA